MKKPTAISPQPSAKNPLRLRAFVTLCYVFFFVSACIPAKVPDQLDDTPGPAVVVTDRTYETGQFIARYPDGWRVVTSEAGAPQAVIFVAPDEKSTIRLLIGSLEEMNFPENGLQTEVRGVTLSDGLEMTTIFSAPPEIWDELLPTFERVIASIKPT
jgi:hypothetical protein